jgi:hypothetical protein
MPASKRGGARKGAGRRLTLNAAQWVVLGDAIEGALVKKIDEWHREAVIAQMDDKLRLEIGRWDATPRLNRPKVSPKTIAKHAEKVSDEIGASGLQRYHPAPTTLPPGIVDPIIRSVTRELSRRWKVPIAFRTAERCWREHQKHMARLRKDGEDDYIPKPDKETESGDV